MLSIYLRYKKVILSYHCNSMQWDIPLFNAMVLTIQYQGLIKLKTFPFNHFKIYFYLAYASTTAKITKNHAKYRQTLCG